VSSSADSQLAKRLRREAKAAARAQAAREAAVRRAESKRRAARRRLPRATAVAVVATGSNVVLYGVEGTPLLWLLAGIATVRAGSAVARLRRPVPAAGGRGLPAAAGSAAFPAVRRLEAVREELRRLLPLVAAAGREAGEEAWQAAAEADTALRWQAARLAAVEPHRGVEPDLLRSLEEGLACQERLVGAVADLVVASADPLAGSRLQDATDALHGLAAGLRELR